MGIIFRRRERGLPELREWLQGLGGEDLGLVRAFVFRQADHDGPEAEALGDGKIASAIGYLLELFVQHGPALLALIKEIMGIFLGGPAPAPAAA